MPFDTDIASRPGLDQAFSKEWAFLAAPGTWFSGHDRVEIAAEARRAMAGEPPGSALPTEESEVVRMVAASSPLISAEWVAGLEDRGVTLPAYVEIIGIVSRLSAVDHFHRALGHPFAPLPEPQAGEPTRLAPPMDLIVGKSFVPMVPPVSIPQTISLVPP